MAPRTLHTGSAIARVLGINPSTWGRWVAAGKAPRVHGEVAHAKLYDGAEVEKFCQGLAALAETEEAA